MYVYIYTSIFVEYMYVYIYRGIANYTDIEIYGYIYTCCTASISVCESHPVYIVVPQRDSNCWRYDVGGAVISAEALNEALVHCHETIGSACCPPSASWVGEFHHVSHGSVVS